MMLSLAFSGRTPDSEIQHNADITPIDMHDVMKRKDLEARHLKSELSQAVVDLEKERAEYEGQMQHNTYSTLKDLRPAHVQHRLL